MSFINYEIGIESTETKKFINDISFCCFFRTPIFKQASYCVLKINIPVILIQQIQNDINNNKHPKFNLSIYMVKRDEEYKRIKQLYYKNFCVVNLKVEETLLLEKKNVSCRLLLVNPILYYMANTNTYNKILNNKTAYQSIQEYEKFIKNTYGNTFFINHIIDKRNINNFIYEQILIKIQNDLNVPTQIINTYKPFHSYNYYFFDDFNLSEECNKDISCTYLNLSNRQILQQFDISKNGEIIQGLRRFEEIKFCDQDYTFNKESQSINFNEYRMIYKNKKSIQSKVPKQDTQKIDENQLDISEEPRKIKTTKSSSLYTAKDKKTIPQSSQFTTLYSPDNPENSMIRFNEAKKFLNEIFENIIVYECNGCMPDWLQFGKLYNLEIDDVNSYLYTPLNIINIFQRKTKKEIYQSHLIKFSMLKYKV